METLKIARREFNRGAAMSASSLVLSANPCSGGPRNPNGLRLRAAGRTGRRWGCRLQEMERIDDLVEDGLLELERFR